MQKNLEPELILPSAIPGKQHMSRGLGLDSNRELAAAINEEKKVLFFTLAVSLFLLPGKTFSDYSRAIMKA